MYSPCAMSTAISSFKPWGKRGIDARKWWTIHTTHSSYPSQWQKKVMTMIEKQDESVIMYVEAPRGAGKTRLGQYMAFKYNACWCSHGSVTLIRANFRDKAYDYLVLDLQTGRSPDDFLMQLKRGQIYDGKEVKFIKPPRILVMSRYLNEAMTLTSQQCRKNCHYEVINDALVMK